MGTENHLTPTERLYELAMTLASKRPSEPTSKVELTRKRVNGTLGGAS